MALSRYRQNLIPVRSQFIQQPYIPNFNEFAGVLQRQQQNYDAATSLADLPVDGLQGKDYEYAQALRAKRYSDIDNIANVFTEQGVNAGNRALRDLTTRIRREELPGGESYELKQRKANFAAFQKTQQERLQKGEIKPWQYKQSVDKALELYNQTGGFQAGTNLNLSGRPQAIDFDKFANEFLKNKEADLVQQGFMRRDPNTGNMIWTEQGREWINKGELQRELSSSYLNAAGQTGELEDYFQTVNPQLSLDSMTSSITEQQKVLDKLKSFNPSIANKSEKEQMQRLMQQYGVYSGDIDGAFGKKSNAGLNQLKSSLTSAIASSQDQLTQLQALPQDQLNQTLKNQFLSEYANRLAEPYAAAKSYEKQTIDVKSLGRTLQDELALHKAKKDIDNETTLQFFDVADAASKGLTSGQSQVPSSILNTKIEIDKDGSVVLKDSSPVTMEEKAKATGKEARENPYKFGMNPFVWQQNVVNKGMNQASKDKIKIASNDPRYINTESWLKRTGKIPQDATPEQVSKAVGQALQYEMENARAGVKYNPLSAKEKVELESTIFNRKSNKFGKEYTAGVAIDRGVIDMQTGEALTAKQIQKMEEKQGGLLSIKGKVDDVRSLGEYGSLTAQVGNKRLYIPPSEGAKTTGQYFLNRLYSAASGGGFGQVVEFETGGIQNLGLPEGQYRVNFVPDEASENTNQGMHYVERKVGSNYEPVGIYKNVNYDSQTFEYIPLKKNK